MPFAHNGGMTTRFLSLLLIALLLSTGCAGNATRGEAAGATFVVVRHAEKASDTGRDPDLSAAGLARAQRLAATLAGAGIVAIYTTDYRRTRQTVQPTAEAMRVEATVYDASEPPDAFAARLKAAHETGTVLVAGHSNTVPDIVAALCACSVEPMPETEYDRLSTIRIAPDGRATLEVARYGTPAHSP